MQPLLSTKLPSSLPNSQMATVSEDRAGWHVWATSECFVAFVVNLGGEWWAVGTWTAMSGKSACMRGPEVNIETKPGTACVLSTGLPGSPCGFLIPGPRTRITVGHRCAKLLCGHWKFKLRSSWQIARTVTPNPQVVPPLTRQEDLKFVSIESV